MSWLFVVRFSALVGNSFIYLLIIMELFLWYGWPVVFTLIFEGFPALNKLSLGFFLFIFCALCFIGAVLLFYVFYHNSATYKFLSVFLSCRRLACICNIVYCTTFQPRISFSVSCHRFARIGNLDILFNSYATRVFLPIPAF